MSYAYDANGNRTSARVDGVPTETATYAGDDRLVQAAAATTRTTAPASCAR